MLVEPSDTVLLLPATTRYESPGGGTETSTERRIVFSPEIAGRRIGEARPEWQVFGDVVARARPAVADSVRFESAQAIRREIAQAVPLYAGIEHLAARGDQVQWGGRGCFRTGGSTRRAAVRWRSSVPMVSRAQGPGEFLVSTRRGKQFNSMVQREVDPLTGASRDAVLMSADGCRRPRGPRRRSDCARVAPGRFEGRAHIAPILLGQPRGALAGRDGPAGAGPARSRVRRARLQRGCARGTAPRRGRQARLSRQAPTSHKLAWVRTQ